MASTPFYLNRMAMPKASLPEVLQVSADLGFAGVELRNDLGLEDPLDGREADQVRRLLEDLDQSVLSINALQRCNDPAILPALEAELQALARAAASIGAPFVVFCPVNDRRDRRTEDQRYGDLVANMRSLASILRASGVTGLIEPLGFAESSLRSLGTAIRAVGEAEPECYQVLLDTFHFAIGPDELEGLQRYPVGAVGLVHISGVEQAVEPGDMRDEHRVFATGRDRLESREQLRLLQARGFEGPVSFEPFSSALRDMPRDRVTALIRESAAYLMEPPG